MIQSLFLFTDMKAMLIKLRTWLMEAKILFNRSISYISILNSGMILFLFLSKLKESGYISFDLGTYFIPLFIITFIIFILIGYMEDKLGFFREEQRRQMNRNPQVNETYKIVKEIQEKIKKFK